RIRVANGLDESQAAAATGDCVFDAGAVVLLSQFAPGARDRQPGRLGQGTGAGDRREEAAGKVGTVARFQTRRFSSSEPQDPSIRPPRRANRRILGFATGEKPGLKTRDRKSTRLN